MLPRLKSLVPAFTIVLLTATACGPQASEHTPDSSTTPAAVDPSTWTPHEEITHREYSDQELKEYRDSLLDRYADDFSGPPPETEFIRWTTTLADDAQAQSTCLTAEGFPATPGYDTGITFEPPVPASQTEAAHLAMYVCHAKYTPLPALTTDWTPAQIGMAWDYWTEAYIPCLEANGITIPDVPTPSRQTFIDTFYSGGSAWYPPGWVPLNGEEELTLTRTCPPRPPHEHFYGT